MVPAMGLTKDIIAVFEIRVPGNEPQKICICTGENEIGDDQCTIWKAEVVLDATVDGYVCSLFFLAITEPNAAKTFLKYLSRVYSKTKFYINVQMKDAEREMIDWKGNEMLERSALERRELDSAFAWFSTLGGAFSALGDTIAKCALIAGKISAQQFRLAVRLGDPYLQSRCRLYAALSLIQQRNFKWAKRIVRAEYEFATTIRIKDNKLVAMCRGVWAKLRYEKYRTSNKWNEMNNQVVSL